MTLETNIVKQFNVKDELLLTLILEYHNRNPIDLE